MRKTRTLQASSEIAYLSFEMSAMALMELDDLIPLPPEPVHFSSYVGIYFTTPSHTDLLAASNGDI
jgi:hypothetical protein